MRRRGDDDGPLDSAARPSRDAFFSEWEFRPPLVLRTRQNPASTRSLPGNFCRGTLARA
jgi:hypothetical protein